VANKYELVVKLAEVIVYEAPDVVTGYNIYNADFPLLYFTLKSSMGKWPRMCAGVETFFLVYIKKLQKHYVESEAGIVVKIPGCHSIDTYFFLEQTLASEEKNMIKLGDV
jgi:DNA polymerase elongation subunit (family B)